MVPEADRRWQETVRESGNSRPGTSFTADRRRPSHTRVRNVEATDSVHGCHPQNLASSVPERVTADAPTPANLRRRPRVFLYPVDIPGHVGAGVQITRLFIHLDVPERRFHGDAILRFEGV